MREFEYNEEAMAAGKNEYTKLASDKQKQFVSDLCLYVTSVIL